MQKLAVGGCEIIAIVNVKNHHHHSYQYPWSVFIMNLIQKVKDCAAWTKASNVSFAKRYLDIFKQKNGVCLF